MPLLYGKKKRTRVSKTEQSLARLEKFRKDVTTDEHKIPLGELCLRLNTDPINGLTPERAKEVLQKTGLNKLTPSRKTPEIVLFIKTLTHGFSLLLWAGAFLCYVAALTRWLKFNNFDSNDVIMGTVLVAVVVLTGAFQYFQERKSSKIMESFQKMVPPMANVIRGGQTISIDSTEVVVGDLINLKFGDRIPADVRIIQGQGFKVDNSALTGESEPQYRSNEFTNENILETKNVAFFSTNALEGTAKGIAIACGDNTVIGHIAGLTARIKPNKTPLCLELERFMRIVSVWATLLGLTIGGLALCMGRGLVEAFVFLIGIIVANVPEGLLATVTVCLTVTSKRMANENCLVKNLEAVETLGCTSVICSDKTGTLTQNRMTVHHVWFGRDIKNAYNRNGINGVFLNDPDFRLLVRCAALCSRAEFLPNQENVPVLQRKAMGDASEEAILKYVVGSEVLGDITQYRNNNRKLCEIPFSSATKFQLSIHAISSSSCLLVMKGAPEGILEKCNKMLVGGETREMNEKRRASCDEACKKMAGNGERVLGFCDLELDEKYTPKFSFTAENPNFPQRGLRFLGFLALIDPARPEVPDALEKCRAAGIKVFMVTGDHPITARAIAQDVGIITLEDVVDGSSAEKIRSSHPTSMDRAIVVHGGALRALSGDELDDVVYNYKEIVFARTSPQQKLQIVESCQRLGEIVAVTGDGVNDAPALKKGNTGIAMGITGTEVSKQSADIILLDDNFATIVSGVEEGRKIFDNLKKSIVYTLSSNMPELFPFICYVIFKIPLPIGVIQVLCIDLLTDMMPAISLAYEKAETDIMQRPPRNPKRDRLVTRRLYYLAYGHLGMIETCGAFVTYFVIMSEYGFWPWHLIGLSSEWDDVNNNDVLDTWGQEWSYDDRMVLFGITSTAVMVSVVVTQWADLLACKTRYNSLFRQGMDNWHVNVSLAAETLMACFLSYAPFMTALKFQPLYFRWWLYALPFSFLLLAFDEMRKWQIRKHPKGYFSRETYY